MKRLKRPVPPAVFAAVLLAAAAAAAAPPSVYIPPGSAQPIFGGEFRLAEVGPVAGYWRTECRNWRVRSQARRAGPPADPALDAAFKRFVSGLITQRPNYDDMSPAMAQSVRRNLPTYWPSFNRMGRATVAHRFDTTKDGDELYVLNQAGGDSHWNLTVNPDGKIAGAFMCEGGGL